MEYQWKVHESIINLIKVYMRQYCYIINWKLHNTCIFKFSLISLLGVLDHAVVWIYRTCIKLKAFAREILKHTLNSAFNDFDSHVANLGNWSPLRMRVCHLGDKNLQEICFNFWWCKKPYEMMLHMRKHTLYLKKCALEKIMNNGNIFCNSIAKAGSFH